MNDTINLVSTNSSKTGAAGAVSKINTAVEGGSGEDAAGSAVSEESFHDLIQNAVEDSQQDNDSPNTESGGNELPVLNDSPDDPAEAGRQLSMLNFSFSTHLSDQNNLIKQPSIEQTQSNLLLVGIDVDGELNGLSSQVRQFLKLDPTVDTQKVDAQKIEAQKINGQQILATGSNINATKSAIENPVMQSPDLSQLNAEQLESLHHKNQVLTTTANQQQVLLNTQTSSLLQTGSTQSEFNPGAMPVLANAVSNNSTAINLPSITQTEIVETFAKPGWSQGMGKQIVWMVQQNISSAEIRLNPANLGPIEVRIDLSEDQVNVALSSRHAVVREAMELALPKLREMFEANGLSLADADISQHSFAEQREQNTADNNRNVFSDNADQGISAKSNEEAIKQSLMSTSMVDYYI